MIIRTFVVKGEYLLMFCWKYSVHFANDNSSEIWGMI